MNTKISQADFNALNQQEQINFINEMHRRLGDPNARVRIGENEFRDRESLQGWQIEMGLIQ